MAKKVGKITNKHGDPVTITQTDTGYHVWNHQWAVGLPADTLEEAADKANYNVENLCQD